MEQCPHSKETEIEILRQSFAGPTLLALADGQDTAAGHEKNAGMRKTRAVLESKYPMGESRFLSKIAVARLPWLKGVFLLPRARFHYSEWRKLITLGSISSSYKWCSKYFIEVPSQKPWDPTEKSAEK